MSDESKLRQIIERTKRYQSRIAYKESSTNSVSNSRKSNKKSTVVSVSNVEGTSDQLSDQSEGADEVFVEPQTFLNLHSEEKLRPNLRLYLPDKPERSRSSSPSYKKHLENLKRNASISEGLEKATEGVEEGPEKFENTTSGLIESFKIINQRVTHLIVSYGSTENINTLNSNQPKEVEINNKITSTTMPENDNK